MAERAASAVPDAARGLGVCRGGITLESVVRLGEGCAGLDLGYGEDCDGVDVGEKLGDVL